MSRRGAQGLSLVETLVTLAVAMLLSLALSQIFVLNQQLWRNQDAGARQQDNARVALELLARAVRSADSWAGVAPGAIRVAANLHLSGRSGAQACNGAWVQDPLDAVHGFDGATAPPFDCLSSADYVAGSDMLALKSANADGLTAAKPAGNASSAWLRLAAGGAGYLFALGDWDSAQAAIAGSGSADHGVYQLPYSVAVYALRPCSVQTGSGHCSARADGGQPVPTLVAVQLTSAGNLEEKPLVENIEQLQFEYGVDSDGDQRLDRYLSAAAVGDWTQVQSVRIGIVVRGDVRQRRRDTAVYAMPGGYRHSAAPAEQQWPRQLYRRDVAVRRRLRP